MFFEDMEMRNTTLLVIVCGIIMTPPPSYEPEDAMGPLSKIHFIQMGSQERFGGWGGYLTVPSIAC